MTSSLFPVTTNQTQESIELKIKDIQAFESGGSYINHLKLFFAYHAKVPNVTSIENVDNTQLKQLFEEKYKDEVVKKHYKQAYHSDKKKMMSIDCFFLLKDGVMINLEASNIYFLYTPETENFAHKWIDIAKTCVIKNKNTNAISLVTNGMDGLRRTPIKFKKPKLNLQLNYNDDIGEMHKSILSKLRVKKASGLFLFHGIPGTGKSTYIKYLIHYLNKDVIFMSPKLAGALDAPDLTTFLLKNRNSIIVIEDAEELITSRDGGRNSSISTILNLTDGLLGECMGIQIIATFNTQVNNIDKALLRKGRLQHLYEFKELSVVKSNVLIQEIGIKNYNVLKPMTLSDIYNMKETDFQIKNERTPIGFLHSKAV
jgi:hypothetical protein